jgi:hypothetical protein
MASLDSLPPDQRAVLQLVLQRGRSYDQIAQLLSIDRDVVRQRALAALQMIGPDARVPDDRREAISDYLLGQLPDDAAEQARSELATSASSRAWARVVASELAPLAANPLPEIPVDQAGTAGTAPETAAPAAAEAPAADTAAAEQPAAAGVPRSSRTGGAILLVVGALVALIVIGVVIVLVASSGGGSSHHSTTAASVSTSAATTTATTSANSSGATPVAAVSLKSPTHTKGTAGFAEVVRQGGKTGLVLVAQGVPANTTHDAYAVWLYNSPSDNHILGFVNPGVKTDGKLQTAGVLPTNASHFRQLLVTLETQARPHGPGKIVLQGPFKLAQ